MLLFVKARVTAIRPGCASENAAIFRFVLRRVLKTPPFLRGDISRTCGTAWALSVSARHKPDSSDTYVPEAPLRDVRKITLPQGSDNAHALLL